MVKLVLGFSLGLIISCAAIIIPKLGNRSLAIHKSGKLYYEYCANRNWFGKCSELKQDFYDLTDPLIRARLEGFVCKRRSRDY